MLGTVDIKLRPLRFAFLVDPGDAKQAREAIRLLDDMDPLKHGPVRPTAAVASAASTVRAAPIQIAAARLTDRE